MTRTVALLFLTMSVPLAGLAQEGKWQGEIKVPGSQIRFSLELVKAESGWSGTIDIPQQRARGVKLKDIAVKDGAVSFVIAGVAGDPTFTGKLDSAGKTISGTMTQGGKSFPFSMLRREAGGKDPKLVGLLAELPEFIEAKRRAWNVPGVAVAIVKDDVVVLARGFGQRDVEKGLPVTPRTQFAIGSCTKAFTTLALQLLVDQGKLAWDAPVRRYLKDFELKDDVATLRMTPLDLVTHRSGLPRHDLVWYGTTRDRAALVRSLRHLEPSFPFRAKFQYQNLMYMTAGYLVGQVSGTTWEAFTRKQILDPLKMKEANLSISDSQKHPDHALPYRENAEREIERMQFRNIDAVAPAGSLNASATEMAQWVRLQLGLGRIGKRWLVKQGSWRMHRSEIVMRATGRYPETGRIGYGLGWMIQSYRGHTHVHHGGAIDGFTALVSLMPREGFGMAILTNRQGNQLPQVISYRVIDRLLGREAIDWHARYTARAAAGRAAVTAARAAETRSRKSHTKPSHPLAEYAGTYENPGYGTITVRVDGEALEMSYGVFTSGLEHWHYDVYRLTAPRLRGKLTFHTHENGELDSLSARLERRIRDPIVFRRVIPRLGISTRLDAGAVVVRRVVPDSPAARAGVKAKDRLVRYAGEEIESPEDLVRENRRRSVGDVVTLELIRDEKPLSIKVTLGR